MDLGTGQEELGLTFDIFNRGYVNGADQRPVEKMMQEKKIWLDHALTQRTLEGGGELNNKRYVLYITECILFAWEKCVFISAVSWKKKVLCIVNKTSA